MNAVPTLYGWLMDLAPVGSYDLSSLRILTYAGSPFPVEVLKRAITVFGPIFAQGYGATETAGGPVTMLEADDHHLDGQDSHLLASAGKAGICSEVKVVDGDDERARTRPDRRGLRPGQARHDRLLEEPRADRGSPEGRLVPHRRPGLPRRTRLPVPHRPQVGHDHQRRRERVPHRGGERHLHPPRRRSNARWSARRTSAGGKWSTPSSWSATAPRSAAEEIIEHCRQALAGYKCPKKVTFLEVLPKTAIGKISRKDIKEMVR